MEVGILAVPGSVVPKRYERPGGARVSYGPWLQRAAPTSPEDVTAALPDDIHLSDGSAAVVISTGEHE